MQARKRAPQCAISAPITAAKRKLDYNRSSYGRLAASGEAQLVSVYLSRVTRLLPCICPPLLLLLQGRRQRFHDALKRRKPVVEGGLRGGCFPSTEQLACWLANWRSHTRCVQQEHARHAGAAVGAERGGERQRPNERHSPL